MKEARTHRSTAAILLAVALGVIAPAVTWAEVGVVTIGSSELRGADKLSVIEDGPGPITQIALRFAYYFGVIEDGPTPITTRRTRLAVIEDGPDPITSRSYRLAIIDEGPDPIIRSKSKPR